MPGGTREIVTLGELVEQGPLQAQTGGERVVALHLLLHLLAQLGQVFEPDRLAELVVDGQRRALAHLLHIDREFRLLAGQIGGRIILGEGRRGRCGARPPRRRSAAPRSRG